MLALAGMGAAQGEVGAFDRQLAARGHGVAGVDRQVQDGAFQLIGVGARAPEIGGRDHRHVDLLAEGAMEQILHGMDQVADVEGLGIQRLAAGEGQEAMGERGRALGRRDGRIHEAEGVFIASALDAPPRQVQAADDAS